MRRSLSVLRTETEPRDPRADAYPMPRVPSGWYVALRSEELAPGAIVNLHYFGKDLVAFRDAEGRAAILDAFCPHYGAHLGVGGRVVDGTIECPFHGWRFAADGSCAHAPFVDKPPRATIERYPVREHSGFVFVHVGESEPSWEVPAIPDLADPRFGPPIHLAYRSRTHVQEMRENIVDESHFHHIHGQDHPSEQRFVADGPWARVEGRLVKRVLGVLFDNDFNCDMYGPGVMVVRTSGEWVRATAIAMTTPVDATTSELRMTYLLEKPRYAPFLHPLLRLAFRVITDPEVDAEIAIWDRKKFQSRPVLLPHEVGIRALRRWYAQFYDGADASGSRARA